MWEEMLFSWTRSSKVSDYVWRRVTSLFKRKFMGVLLYDSLLFFNTLSRFINIFDVHLSIVHLMFLSIVIYNNNLNTTSKALLWVESKQMYQHFVKMKIENLPLLIAFSSNQKKRNVTKQIKFFPWRKIHFYKQSKLLSLICYKSRS